MVLNKDILYNLNSILMALSKKNRKFEKLLINKNFQKNTIGTKFQSIIN